MQKLIDYVCEELEDIGHKADKNGKLSASEIQYADTLAHLKKNLLKAEEMDGYSGRGYSRRMSYADNSNYGDYVRPDGSYARGRGAGAKRDSMGRYSSEGSIDEHTKRELMKMIENM